MPGILGIIGNKANGALLQMMCEKVDHFSYKTEQLHLQRASLARVHYGRINKSFYQKHIKDIMKIPPKIVRLPVIWELRKLTLFCFSLIKALFEFRNVTIVYDSVVYFPVWWKYQQKTNEPLKNDLPYVSKPQIIS